MILHNILSILILSVSMLLFLSSVSVAEPGQFDKAAFLMGISIWFHIAFVVMRLIYKE